MARRKETARTKLKQGKWAQVIGSYDLEAKTGSIRSVQPTTLAFAPLEGGEDRVHVKGFGTGKSALFDLAVNPLRISCGDVGSELTFEEFIPVKPSLKTVRLYVDGAEVARYEPGVSASPRRMGLGPPDPAAPNRLAMRAEVAPTPGVSYTVQVRPEGDARWHTIGTGLEKPDAASIDINQFPGAKRLDIRILQADGFRSEEIFRETKRY